MTRRCGRGGSPAVGRRAALLAVLWMAWLSPATLLAQAPERILVMPFENVKRDSRLFWVGEAAAIVIADDLNALGAVAIPREERRQGFERLQVPPAAALTAATVIRIGQIVGATRAMTGSVELQGETLVVRARLVSLETGRLEVEVSESSTMADLLAGFARVAERTARSTPSANVTGVSFRDLAAIHQPLAAFEHHIKGLLAQTPAAAIHNFEAALSVSPGFDRARLGLWNVYTEQGEWARALEAVQAVPAQSPFGRRARFLAGLSELELKRYDEAFKTFKALADERATPAVWNNLGVARLRGRQATQQGEWPTSFFDKARDADPAEPDYLFNLGYAMWEARDPQGAVRWLREAVRRNAADADAHFVLAAALAASSQPTEATRERELARRLSARYETTQKRPNADQVPKGLERVKNEIDLPHAWRVDLAVAANERRDQQALARFYLDRSRRLFQQQSDRDAVAELRRALYLSPYLAEAHLLLGRVHLRNGRVRDAMDALKISIWSEETAEAHAVLGEAYRQAKDVGAARVEADRALAIDPASAEARALLAKL